MKILISTVILLSIFINSQAQTTTTFADSIRVKYGIPELAYAVVSSDSIFEMQSLGFQRVNTNFKAKITDKFRIGSNTKTITSYIASLLVKQGKITWTTKFFDLYPELKPQSDPAYYDFTLQDFVTFRANINNWSYDKNTPTQSEIKGNNQQQRYEFIAWILKQKPVLTDKQALYWSNPSYVAVGLMLEKATNKTYETLVKELGKELNIDFDFGPPNLKDKNQPWGHDDQLIPEKPALNYKLNWLSSAGNINVSLPDYSKFIQLQTRGLLGKSKTFTAEEFNTMHFGLPEFSYGWESYIDEKSKLKYSFHEGNPGTFLTKAYICKDTNRAFILFANVQSDEADKGLIVLLEALKMKYNPK
jgi:CubicO group peptidase (beta-lactamase class C family)